MNKIALLSVLSIVLISGCVGQTTPPVTTTTTTPTQTTTSPTQTGEVTTTTTAGVKEFQLTITHSGYSFKDSSGASVSTLTVNQGDTVKISAVSDPQAHNHGITIDSYNIDVPVTSPSGSTPQIIEFVANVKGTFEIYCNTCLSGAAGAHPQLKSSLVVQ